MNTPFPERQAYLSSLAPQLMKNWIGCGKLSAMRMKKPTNVGNLSLPNQITNLLRAICCSRRLLAVLTLVGAVIAGRQAYIANESMKASQQAAYAACVSAKISRNALLEAQKSDSDNHAAVLATSYQALVATESERAVIKLKLGSPVIIPGFPIGVPVDLENIGKTLARNVVS
jgi:hypothetical protein